MQRFITVLVISIHICLIVAVLFTHRAKPSKKNHHLVVRTVAPLQEKLSVATPKSIPTAPVAQLEKKPLPPKPVVQKQIPPKPAPVAKPAPETKKAVEKKPPVEKTTTPIKKRTTPVKPSVSQDLLQELEESIAKIDGKRDKWNGKKSSDVPKSTKAIGALKSVELLENEDSGKYQESLVRHLKGALHLPEFGEVKIQLTLKRDGTVAGLIVMKAESEKNRKYLEKNLPLLHFPTFIGYLEKEAQSTFVLTFCNEI